MTRKVTLAILGILLLAAGSADSGPLGGPYQEPKRRGYEKGRGKLEAGQVYQFRDVFRGNQRACVIVEGDHEPVMNLKLQVFDGQNQLVAQDVAGGDIVAVIWYPPKTQTYTITVTSNGNTWNGLDIVVK
jgi:hypothetical protein